MSNDQRATPLPLGRGEGEPLAARRDAGGVGDIRVTAVGLLIGFLWLQSQANPIAPTVTQGKASFSSQGSHLTIQTSDRAFINWQSFNIGVGQTTTFLQPSSSSLVWKQINDRNPSKILGNLI